MSIHAISRTGRMMVTTFGLGFLRPAPGTWGSMPPVILAAAMLMLMRGGEEEDGAAVCWCAWWAYHAVLVAVMVVFGLACMVWGDYAEAAFGKKDPGHVCADETAGVCLALLFPPVGELEGVWEVLFFAGAAFFAFRIFDIIKLPPARGLQRHPGGVGILLDDLVAGVQALIVVQVVVRVVL